MSSQKKKSKDAPIEAGVPDKNTAAKRHATRKSSAKKESPEQQKLSVAQTHRKAEKLYEKAMDAEDDDIQRELLESVLQLNPEHDQALMSLASLTYSIEEAFKFTTAAIASLEKQLGPQNAWPSDIFDSDLGYNYLEAKHLLSEIYDNRGNVFEAATTLKEIFLLDPSDPLDCVMTLVNLLAIQRRWDELETVLAANPIPQSIDITFVQALCTFHREGDSKLAQAHLREAINAGPEAVKYFTGEVPIGSTRPPLPLGSSKQHRELAAEEYVREMMCAWRGTPGAITWLKAHATKLLPQKGTPPRDLAAIKKAAKSGITKLRKTIKNLPQADGTTWLVDVRKNDNEAGWGLMAADIEEGSPVGLTTFEGEPSIEEVVLAILEIIEEVSHRPQRLELTTSAMITQLSKQLLSIGVDVELLERADELNRGLTRDDRPIPDTPLDEVEQDKNATWIMDWAQFSIWAANADGAPIQPWTITIMDTATELILVSKISDDAPTLEDLAQALRVAVFRPIIGSPGRPGKIRVRSADNRIAIADWLKSVGIGIEVGEMDSFDAMFADLSETMMGDSLPGFTEIKGVSLQLIEQLYEASVRFYKSGVWAHSRYGEILQLSCQGLTRKLWCVLIVGQREAGLGLIMVDNLQAVSAINAGSDATPLVPFTGITFSLDEKFTVSTSDAAAADQFGWPVAAPEAWPSAVRICDDGSSGALSARDLRWLVACIECIPLFYQQAQKPTSLSVAIESVEQRITIERINT